MHVKRLAHQYSQVVQYELLQLVGRFETPIRDVVVASNPVDEIDETLLASGAGRFTYTNRGLPADSAYSSSSPDTSMPGATQPYRCQYSPTNT